MKKEEKGVWSWESKEELHGVYYDYLITRDDEEVRSADPYAKHAELMDCAAWQ